LVTGGAGYIGAHVVRALQASGREVVVFDDLSSGDADRLPPRVELVRGSVADVPLLTATLRRTSPQGVLHLAAKKSPTESMTDPLLYARENVGGVMALIEALRASGCANVVFSSSSSVYGSIQAERVSEDAPKSPTSPYGESKLYGEQLLAAAAEAYGLGLISLRYFNVVGAAGPELADHGVHNLVPLVLEALGQGREPVVYGDDYPTPDGTCVRDYVDVEDVADAHVRAVETLEQRRLVAVYNVGRGTGSSVLEVLQSVRDVTGLTFDHQVLPRRPGDPARVVGAVDRIEQDLSWTASRDLADMVAAAWRAAERSSEPENAG
jgi:UDP-glucose 4-epimerase